MADVRMNLAWALLIGVPVLGGCASALTWEPKPQPERTRVEATEPLAPERRLAETEYLVQPGDTMYSIAFRKQVDFRELAEWNGVDGSFLIHPGQVLRLTPPDDAAPEAPVNGETARALPTPPPSSSDRPVPLAVGPVGSAVGAAPLPSGAPAPAATPPPVAAAPPAAAPAAVHTPDKPPVLSELGWTWPTKGAIERGYNPAQGSKGLFFTGSIGQPVIAAAPGKVVYSGNALRGYGELVIIKHDEVHLSAYGHNSKRLVKEGDTVKVGQPIAEMGEGPERRPMLHFEIRERGQPVNPAKFLPTSR